MTIADLLCAAVAGACCRLPCHPLDTIKTVAYTEDGSTGKKFGFRQGYREIMRREGWKGLFRGWGIATFGSAPGVGAYLTSYDWAKQQLQGTALDGRAVGHLGCGMFAEAVSCVFWVPIDVVKERLQAQHPGVVGRYRGSWDGLATCLRNESVSGLYKGYFSTLASFGPTSAVYFMAFEYFGALLKPLDLSPFAQGLLAGGLGNATAAVVTNPLELVKTRLQVQRCVLTVEGQPQACTQYRYQYSSFLSGLRALVREEGIGGLQRGVVARMGYTVPNAALTMAMYQWLKKVTSPSEP